MGCTLDMTVTDPTELVFQVAVAQLPGARVRDKLTVTLDGKKKLRVHEVASTTGTRMHIVEAPEGSVTLTYEATVKGRFDRTPVGAAEISEYLRPSRYVESDKLAEVAAQQFSQLKNPADLLAGVAAWVGSQLSYVPGSSGPTDGATDTLRIRKGVCRDYAHLTAALLRARGVAARMVGVYAPGCDPMDFHAVVEANVDGVWRVVDATLLAPRQALVRIATGRDGADTAFMSNNGGAVSLDNSTVTAVVDGRLPTDDIGQLVEIS
jgi:transglutaminase-like putative cysteine protease